jgi:hypothetical protein
MNDHRIEAHKVTKPIQLLAAWLVGLCVLDSAFLVAAAAFKEVPLACGILISAAVLNVPVFLYSLFLLQTKYRPEMQEDTYYATYLDKNTNRAVEVMKPSFRDARVDELCEEISLLRNQITHLNSPTVISGHGPNAHRTSDWDECRIALNDNHPDFWAIRKALKAASIPVAAIFGAVDGNGVPQKFVLAVNVDADPQLLQRALQELLKFSFEGIKLCERVQGSDQTEDIYAGSYALQEGYALITDELRRLIESGLEPLDLAVYVSKHIEKPSRMG